MKHEKRVEEHIAFTEKIAKIAVDNLNRNTLTERICCSRWQTELSHTQPDGSPTWQLSKHGWDVYGDYHVCLTDVIYCPFCGKPLLRQYRQPLLCGGALLLHADDVVAADLHSEKTYEPEVREEFLQAAKRGGNVLDIGANLGYYSVLAGLTIGPERRVWAFEPQPNLILRLMSNLYLNKLQNVSVLRMALSDHNGYAAFHVPMQGHEIYGSLHPSGRYDVQETIRVEVKRLDDVVASNGITDVRLIKLDVEGAELSVLRGAGKLLATRPVLLFEANERNLRPFGYTVSDVLDFVSSHGYHVRRLGEENWVAE